MSPFIKSKSRLAMTTRMLGREGELSSGVVLGLDSVWDSVECEGKCGVRSRGQALSPINTKTSSPELTDD